MFGNKKNRRVINSLFEMYEIFYEAISSAHMEGVYTGKKYNKMYETYSDNMLSVAKAVSGEEGVFQLSMLCSQYHGENVEILNKECEEIEERALRDAEKEANNMEEKYDGYVTTVTKSPVYSDRWQQTLSGQPWQPAIGEAGWHAREGEMGRPGQEKKSIWAGRNRFLIIVPYNNRSIQYETERDFLLKKLQDKSIDAVPYSYAEIIADTAMEMEMFNNMIVKLWRERKFPDGLNVENPNVWQLVIFNSEFEDGDEMGHPGQEKTGAEFVIGGGRGVESGPLRGADEKPVVTYIYHIKITHQKEVLEITWERDKLFDILKNMGFEVSKVDWKTICIHTTNNSSGFVKIVNSACERSGVGADYEAVYKGKMVPVVRYEEVIENESITED